AGCRTRRDSARSSVLPEGTLLFPKFIANQKKAVGIAVVFEHGRKAAVDVVGRLDEALQRRARTGRVGRAQRVDISRMGRAQSAEQQGDQPGGAWPYRVQADRSRADGHRHSPAVILGTVAGMTSGFA